MWIGTTVETPSVIAVGTGSNSVGVTASDTGLWDEFPGSRQTCDYTNVFLSTYAQYSITYDSTELLANVTNSFNDPLTGYTGSTANGWVASGTVTYGSTGVTASGAGAASVRSTTCTDMDASVGYPVSIQATFKIPSATINTDYIHLWQDASNYYEIYINAGYLKIAKTVNGVHTVLVQSSTSATWTAKASYTLTASIDSTGLITGNVYSGTSATGTPLLTVSSTDTALPGPYSIQVGGDSGVVMSNAQATYPNIDTTLQVSLTEAGLFDSLGNLWSHVALQGVTHDNTTTLSIQWQVLMEGN